MFTPPRGSASSDAPFAEVATELKLVHLILILGFSSGARWATQADTLSLISATTHGFALVELPLCTRTAFSVQHPFCRRKEVGHPLFKAVKDVVPLKDVVGDGATLLAPVNRSVAGTHEGLLAVHILTCPVAGGGWPSGRRRSTGNAL